MEEKYRQSQKWRELFNSDLHSILSHLIFDIYCQNLCFCKGLRFLGETHEIDQRIVRINKRDISETGKLVTQWVETSFLNKRGFSRSMPLAQYLKMVVFQKNEEFSAKMVKEISDKAYRASEFEIISQTILTARNINAHNSALVNDVGFVCSIMAAVIRLCELYDSQILNHQDLEKLKYFCARELIKSSEVLAEIYNLDKETSVVSVEHKQNELRSESSECEQESSRLSSKNKKEDEVFESSEIQVQNDTPFPNKTEIGKQTFEQKRQSLQDVKNQIFEHFRIQGMEFNRRMCIVSGNAGIELLHSQSSSLEKIYQLPQYIFLKDRYPVETNEQLKIFGKEILSIIKETK